MKKLSLIVGVINVIILAGIVNPVSIVTAENNTLTDGNVLYIRNQVDTQKEAVFYETGQVTIFHVGECRRISPNLDYVVLVNPDLFDELRFINLATGEEFSIPWQNTWNLNCTLRWYDGMDWLDNEVLMITSAANLDEVYYLNRITFSVSGPYPEPNREIPLYSQDHNITAYSPTGNYVIYDRCIEVECINTQFAIYNLAQEELVAWLDGHGYIISRPLPAENFFSWSHSERYVAYASLEYGISIYDVLNRSERPLSFLPTNFNQLTDKHAWSWKWSPDESQVAFWASRVSRMGYSFDEGLVVINLVDETFSIINIPFDSWPRNLDAWGWSPSGDSILLVENDKNLYELNLATGLQTLIDSNVEQIYFWYAGI